jgi:hypothetical protein
MKARYASQSEVQQFTEALFGEYLHAVCVRARLRRQGCKKM